MLNRVNVTRRWLSDGAQVSYLEDRTVTLEELPNTFVLILVGDPGSGKTETVKELVRLESPRRLLRSFADVTSTEHLQRWIQECNETNSELFLDAYDERSGKYRRRFLLDPLYEALRSGACPLIRIVSRDTHLDRSLVEDIEDRVGKGPNESVVYRLLPLDEERIRFWVRERLGSQDVAFFQEVERNQLEPYLGRPTDLEAFIEVFRKSQSLGGSPTAAWSTAILQEVSEPNPDRLDEQSDIAAKIDPADRYRIAQVLAVAQEICGIPAIVLDGATPVAMQNGAASIDSLWQDVKPLFPNENKEFFKCAVTETAQSRLFEPGKDGIHFASAAKAQFLAAQFLVDGDRSQIINLLKDKQEGKRIPERAQPVAAEVAKFDRPLFEWLCTNQPDALLRGVVMDYTTERRAQLAEAILRYSDKRTPWATYGNSLSALDHPGLADQLRPYLEGQVGNSKDLNLAIDIAERTRCSEVADALAAVANDPQADLDTKVNAAMALARMGPDHAELLRPLLQVSRGIDKYDELYGAALLALWPQGFSPGEAFEVLRDPQQVSGVYHGFLSYYHDGPALRLTRDLLESGLEWLAKRERQDRSYRDDFDRLSWSLVKMAWENMDSPAVPGLLAQVAQSRFERHAGSALPFREKPTYPRAEMPIGLDAEDYINAREKRWALLEAWLLLPIEKRTWFEALRFVIDNEIEGLISLAKVSEGETLGILKQAITNLTCGLIREKREPMLRMIRPALKDIGIDLGALRGELRKLDQKMESNRRPRYRKGFDSGAHEAALAKVLKGADTKQFLRLLSLLSIDTNGWQDSNGHQISAWGRWKQLDEEQQGAIVLIAKEFLKNGPSTPRPPRKLSMSDWDWAGMYALILTAELDLEWLRSNSEITRLWLPYLSTLRNFAGIDNHPSFTLFSLLTENEAAREIYDQIQLQKREGFDPIHTDRFSELWTSDIGFSLARESRSWPQLARQCMVTVLFFQKHRATTAELQMELRSRAVARRSFAMRLILTYGITDLFAEVAELALRSDGAFEELWQLVWNGSRLDREDGVERFGLVILKRLFSRAVDEAPPASDIEFRSGPVTLEYTRQRLRDKFAGCIARNLSLEAQEFVAEWAKKKPFSWLKDTALRAKQEWLEQSWSPPSLASVIRLKAGSNKQFITTQKDLREVVEQALETIRPDFEALELNWSDAASGKPALEEPMTKNLAKWLEPRLKGLVVNAEVSCREGRTDIQIEASVENDLGEPYRLKCVIEAKRCLNRSLLTGISGQLVRKYLRGNGGETGIYLILWFGHLSDCTHCSNTPIVRQELEEQAMKSVHDISVIHFDIRNPLKSQRSKGIVR